MGKFGTIVDGVACDSPEEGVPANLRFFLQLLAAPAQDQIDHFLPPINYDIEAEMARDFEHWARCVRTYVTLTAEQTRALQKAQCLFRCP